MTQQPNLPYRTTTFEYPTDRNFDHIPLCKLKILLMNDYEEAVREMNTWLRRFEIETTSGSLGVHEDVLCIATRITTPHEVKIHFRSVRKDEKFRNDTNETEKVFLLCRNQS